MLVLDLFCGTKSLKTFIENKGWEYKGLDIEKKHNPEILIDFLEWDYKSINPDIIWASPPCRTFSIASCSTHWSKEDGVFTPKTEDAKTGLNIIKKMKEIIDHYTKLNHEVYFIIENPRGLLRKMPEMQIYNYNRQTVWYCQYGDTRAKPTDIWTNINWIPRPVCKNGNPNCGHEKAPRGSKTGTQGLSNNYERSKVPSQLCKELINSIGEK